MQLTDDKTKDDINYNNLTQRCLETLDEVRLISSHLGNMCTESNSKNIEEFRKFLLLWLDMQKKTAWKYIPVSYQKVTAEQSDLLSKNIIQSIQNLDFVYSYSAIQYQQNFGIWSDYVSIWTQNIADMYGIHVRLQSTGSEFIYEQDKQFVKTIHDTENAYEKFDHTQNANKKIKSKSIQSNGKILDDTSGSSVI
jgi:hypothetical protein